MTSVFTYGSHGANPLAAKYGEIARRASSVGSKYFIFNPAFDDVMAFPRHHHRQSDVPWRDCLTFARWRWIVHDFRMFGLFGAIKKQYYMGESWRTKDERIFAGKDENGNKYWMSRRSAGTMFVRFMEPTDPHWFRGQSSHGPSAMWQKWMQGNMAHTPAQIAARGEWGLNSRVGRPLPFNVKHDDFSPILWGEKWSRDPLWMPSPTALMSPERKVIEEAGFSRWVQNQGAPVFMPFSGVHDYSDELVEEYYRGQWAFGRTSKGNDHDEWRN